MDADDERIDEDEIGLTGPGVLVSKLIEEARDTEPSPVGMRPIDWHTYSHQRDEAVVLDEGLFKENKCYCFQKDDKKACFSDIAVGVLSEGQAGGCKEIETKEMPEEMASLMQAAGECGGSMGEWVECMVKKDIKF